MPRPGKKITAYERHKAKWSNCDLCPLSERRRKVVLARGTLPAEVVFIGEAPGGSENLLGLPFIGPAGKLLDQIIAQAIEDSGVTPSMAFTNLVGCIPFGEEGTKTEEPPKESILACEPRLKEIVRIAKPRVVIQVGKLAKKYVTGQAQFDCDWLPEGKFLSFFDIYHPAAILRADVAQKPIAIQRTVVTLADAFSTLV